MDRAEIRDNDYRLTEGDEQMMRDRMAEVVAEWDSQSPVHRHTLGGTDRESLRRIAAHAIGCSLDDLRDVEVQWINNEIGELDLFR